VSLIDIVDLTNEYKEEVERIAADSWGGIKVAAHRELYDLRELPCFITFSDKREILGYCYYRFSNSECEIMAIESIQQNRGIGTALIKKVKELAYTKNCTRIYLQTTNDNTHALRFYQRHGFTMRVVRLNELDYLRKIKPSIPLVGYDNIPLLHEFEFEMIL
jgi:GNAT superfamily N-acetyltransferase